jgi:hypothetical protein
MKNFYKQESTRYRRTFDREPSNPYNEEIYNYIQQIKPYVNTKDKAKNLNKNKQLEIIPEDKVKSGLTREANKGLTDNILNDYETKNKARKGLLYLLNNLSSNQFCPEIKTYFQELKDSHHLKLEQENNAQQGRKVFDNNKNFMRQNFIERHDTIKDSTAREHSIRDDDIYKINNFNRGTNTNTKGGEKNTNSQGNNSSNKPIQFTFKKRTKNFDKENDRKNTEGCPADDGDFYFKEKTYKEDFQFKELLLFYDEHEVENSRRKYQKGGKDFLLNQLSNHNRKRSKRKKQHKMNNHSEGVNLKNIRTMNSNFFPQGGPGFNTNNHIGRTETQMNFQSKMDLNQLKSKFPEELANINNKNKNFFKNKIQQISNNNNMWSGGSIVGGGGQNTKNSLKTGNSTYNFNQRSNKKKSTSKVRPGKRPIVEDENSGGN